MDNEKQITEKLIKREHICEEAWSQPSNSN